MKPPLADEIRRLEDENAELMAINTQIHAMNRHLVARAVDAESACERARDLAVRSGVFTRSNGNESRFSHALNDGCEECGTGNIDLMDADPDMAITGRPSAYDMPVGSVVKAHDYDGNPQTWTRTGSDDWRRTGNENERRRTRSGWIEGLFTDGLVTEWRLP
jgi:hypothetical protein